MFTDFAIPISQSAIVCATNVPWEPISRADPGPDIFQNASYSLTKLWEESLEVFVTPESRMAIVTFAPLSFCFSTISFYFLLLFQKVISLLFKLKSIFEAVFGIYFPFLISNSTESYYFYFDC